MAKVRFYCDSGANAVSKREETLDTVADLRLEEGEWEGMSEADRQGILEVWAYDRLEIGYQEINDD